MSLQVAVLLIYLLGDVFDCGSLSDPEFGEVTFSSTTEGSVATYSCFTGYVLKGVESRTCTADGWSGSEPSCERKSQLYHKPLCVWDLYPECNYCHCHR